MPLLSEELYFLDIFINLFFFFLINLFTYLFYFWLHWVFVAAHGLSLVAESGGSLFWCAGFSLGRLLLLQSMGSRLTGFSSCGARAQPLLQHVGSSQTRARTRAPPHWQADSQPLRHQGSPINLFLMEATENAKLFENCFYKKEQIKYLKNILLVIEQTKIQRNKTLEQQYSVISSLCPHH